jgi:hypothetical protein
MLEAADIVSSISPEGRAEAPHPSLSVVITTVE